MPDVTATGFGITVEFASGFFAEILDVTLPEQVREAIETTHTVTPNGDATFIPSEIVDNGELQLDIAFHPDKTVPIHEPAEPVRINFPSGTKWDFDGFMTSHAPTAPIDDRMTATVAVKVTGGITITPGA
jgi:hypothetical protein